MSQAIPYLAFSLSATDLTGTADGSPADKSLSQDWNRNRSYSLPGGGSQKPRVSWVSVSGSTTGTTVVFAIETSIDGTTWASMGAMAAISGDSFSSANGGGNGVSLMTTPLRYLRLTKTSGTAHTDGVITWGIA